MNAIVAIMTPIMAPIESEWFTEPGEEAILADPVGAGVMIKDPEILGDEVEILAVPDVARLSPVCPELNATPEFVIGPGGEGAAVVTDIESDPSVVPALDAPVVLACVEDGN